jgi:putative endonuclease
MHYVYVIQCKDGTFYTGWTTDVEARVKAHTQGTGAKYTKGRGPVTLVHVETFAEKSDALKREGAIKKMTRSQKLQLINLIK